MCGIFGIVRHDGGPLRAGRIERMADVIRHRGPDNTGIHQEPDVALGNNRLAIIDVATGNQPIYNEEEHWFFRPAEQPFWSLRLLR